MAVTVADIRSHFPSLANAAAYPDAEVQFWIDVAYKLHDPRRWGDFLDDAVQLYVAHNVAIDGPANASASGSGGTPGGVSGPLSSASVDKVSYSRDARAANLPDAGDFNLTTWGLRWYRLMKMAGAGPVQVSVPPGGTNNPMPGGGFWPGVIPPWQG